MRELYGHALDGGRAGCDGMRREADASANAGADTGADTGASDACADSCADSFGGSWIGGWCWRRSFWGVCCARVFVVHLTSGTWHLSPEVCVQSDSYTLITPPNKKEGEG